MEEIEIPHYSSVVKKQNLVFIPKSFLCLLILTASIFASTVPARADDGTPSYPPPRIPAEPAYDVHAAQAPSASALSVDLGSRSEALSFFRAVYLASDNTPIEWSGNHANCNPGQTSAYYRESILRRINFFRAMAGVPAGVELSQEYNSAAQEAALMMSVNSNLSHSPGDNWTCYTESGADAAGHSNLYLSSYMANPINGYIKDPGGGNYFVGHRRWILHPSTQFMGTGDVPAVNGFPATNTLWVIDDSAFAPRPTTRHEFVAWPPPGFVPYPVVYARWSFGYPGADFSAATVTMQRNNQAIDVRLDGPVEEGYGENTLVWIPMGLDAGHDWEKPDADTVFSVSVNNVRINGESRNFSYTVTVFDPEIELVDNSAPEITLTEPVGAPGSFFTVVGSNYGAGEVLDVKINGNYLATVTTDGSGRFAAILTTDGVDTGVFKMSAESVSAQSQAAVLVAADASSTSTYFTLDATAPAQPKTIPPGAPEPVELEVADAISAGISVFLPAIHR